MTSPNALVVTTATGLTRTISTDPDRCLGEIKRPVFQGDFPVLGRTYDARCERFASTTLRYRDGIDLARISVNQEPHLRTFTATSDETSSQKLALDIHGHYDNAFGLSVLGKKIASLETHIQGKFIASSKQSRTERSYLISWNYTIGTVGFELAGRSDATIDSEDTHVISDIVYGKVISLMMTEQSEDSTTSVELRGSGSGKLKVDVGKLADWFTQPKEPTADENVEETKKAVSIQSSFKKELTERSFKFSLETRGFTEVFTSPTTVEEALSAVRALLEQARNVKRENLKTLDQLVEQGFVPISMNLQPIKKFAKQDTVQSLVYQLQAAKTTHIFDVFERLERLDWDLMQLCAAVQTEDRLVPKLFNDVHAHSRAYSFKLNKVKSDFGSQLVQFRAHGDELHLGKINETLANAEEQLSQAEEILAALKRRWSRFGQLQSNAQSRTDIRILFGTKEEIERDFNTKPKGLVAVIMPSHTTKEVRECITKAVWLTKWQLEMSTMEIVSHLFFLEDESPNEQDLFDGMLRTDKSNQIQVLGWYDTPEHERVWFEVNEEVWFCRVLSDEKGRFAGQMKRSDTESSGWEPHGSGLLIHGDDQSYGEWRNGILIRFVFVLLILVINPV
jgi:hypothetical protein